MVSGTKMSFAGLGKVEDRAAIAAYLNAQGSNLPFPAAAAAAPTPTEGEAAEGEAEAVAAAEAGTDPAVATD